jgi:enoyl-CoA hydratase/carnithine racemase
MDATTAQALGLVSRVVKHDQLLSTALDFVQRMLRNPPPWGSG